MDEDADEFFGPAAAPSGRPEPLTTSCSSCAKLLDGGAELLELGGDTTEELVNWLEPAVA